MSNQGQRFRRRAVRRGYKVDEVDSFLDRVEATLNGVPGAAVSAQEVHDVVFRVRFGGYDEWQVDLHLDRVERQLGELEERSSQPGRGAELRATELRPEIRAAEARTELRPPSEMRPAEPRMAPPMAAPPMAPPMTPGTGALPSRPVPSPGPQRFEDPTFASAAFDNRDPGFDPGRHGKSDMTTEIRMPDASRFNQPSAGPGYQSPPPGYTQQPPPGYAQQPPPAPQPPAYGQPSAGPSAPHAGPSVPQGPPPAGPGFNGGGFTQPPPVPPAPAGPTGELQRVDQMRRAFQLRRFGSGYDPSQVDRLFDGVISALAGHGHTPISDAELDPGQFSLVPGGYYEGEVDAALREIRDIVRRR